MDETAPVGVDNQEILEVSKNQQVVIKADLDDWKMSYNEQPVAEKFMPKLSENQQVDDKADFDVLKLSEKDQPLPEQVNAKNSENQKVGAEAASNVRTLNDNEKTVIVQVAPKLSENQQVGTEADFGVQKVSDNEQQVSLKLSENKGMAAVGGESPSLECYVEEPTEKSKSEVPVEVDSKDESGFVDTSISDREIPETNDAEAAETAIGLEWHDNGNFPSANQMEIDSEKSNVVEVKDVGFADTRLTNGHVCAEMEVMEPQFVPKDNHVEMPMEEENVELPTPVDSFAFNYLDGYGSGTEEEQDAFISELDRFYKSKSMDFKPPKFYGDGLNCLKLWRAVAKLGGYEQVTSCKLWRQVGESFKPPKTCTTISWTFRNFYEKALLEYEKYKIQTGQLQVPPSNASGPAGIDNQVGASQGTGSGRARRDAAARAMQGWHSQRLLGNGEVGEPIIKEKSPLKKKKGSSLEHVMKIARANDVKLQEDIMVDDVGEPADWVKINMRRTKDCFEIYALVPGLLREEVQVQSDPVGRLIITGNPEKLDNPWGITPFKKIITLPSRIDPHQTSAVVTLHGQLFIRAPFESDP